jgi:hypothetical protein
MLCNFICPRPLEQACQICASLTGPLNIALADACNKSQMSSHTQKEIVVAFHGSFELVDLFTSMFFSPVNEG